MTAMTYHRDPATDATMLLTARLVRAGHQEIAEPLTPVELAELETALQGHGQTLDDLLAPRARANYHGAAADAGIDAERIDGLLGRGVALALRIDEWNRHIIRQVTRNEAAYPTLNPDLDAEGRPPIIHVISHDPRALAQGPADRVRVDCRPEPSRQTESIIGQLARQLRERDKTAVVALQNTRGKKLALALLEQDVPTIIVAAGGLERHALDRDFRSHIMDGVATIISRTSPHLPAPDDQPDELMLWALTDRGVTVRGGSRPTVERSP